MPALAGGRPEPVGGAVGEPTGLQTVESVADAQHAGLILPGAEQVLRFRIVEPQAAHHRKTMRPFLRRLHRVFVAIAFPGRRHDDDAVDTGFVHASQELVVREQPRNVRLPDAVGGPGTLGRVRKPDVDLRVHDDAARGLCLGGFGCLCGHGEACTGGDGGGESTASRQRGRAPPALAFGRCLGVRQRLLSLCVRVAMTADAR